MRLFAVSDAVKKEKVLLLVFIMLAFIRGCFARLKLLPRSIIGHVQALSHVIFQKILADYKELGQISYSEGGGE
jgi:hypothetical protein